MVDQDDFDRGFGGLEAQAKLVGQCGEERWRIADCCVRRGGLRSRGESLARPAKGEVVEPCEARLVDYRMASDFGVAREPAHKIVHRSSFGGHLGGLAVVENKDAAAQVFGFGQ